MTIITRNNGEESIVLDNVVSIRKGNSYSNSERTFYGQHTIVFRSVKGDVTYWVFGTTDKDELLRDQEYERITNKNNIIND